MSEETLTPENTTIQERTVSIKVLTIGTKQVSQTLYRQLPEEDILNQETGEIAGNPWGWVNIHIDCEAKYSHLHVIWERDGILKRARVPESVTFVDGYEYLTNNLYGAGTAYVYAATLEGTRWLDTDGKTLSYGPHILRLRTAGGWPYRVDTQEFVAEMWNLPRRITEARQKIAEIETKDESEFHPGQYSDKSYILNSAKSQLEYHLKEVDHARERIIQGLDKLIESYDIQPGNRSVAHFKEEVDKIGVQLTQFRDTWQKNYETLEQQGQLFIAVSGVWK